MKTRTPFIDRKVWLTMGTACLLALILLAFKAVTRVDCNQFKITIVTHSGSADGIAGQEIDFSVNSNDEEAVWNFGDGSEAITGKAVKHKFFRAGTFTVTVRIAGNCLQFENISIKQKTMPTATELTQFAGPIYGDTTIPAGSSLSLTSTSTAENYSWTVIGQPNYGEKMDRNVVYVFGDPGDYTIQLVLDGQAGKTFTHKVKVTAPEVSDILNSPVLPELGPVGGPAPVNINAQAIKDKAAAEAEANQAAAEEKSFTAISDPEMKLLLGDLVTGKKAPTDFEKYLCNGVNTKTIVNGQATVFAELAGMLQGKKGILGLGGKKKITSVHQTFDPDGRNCVMVLNVKFK